MKSTFPRVVLCGVLAIAFSLALCTQADARGTIIGLDDPRSGVKDPFRGNYEVRGQGFVHNVGNLWVNVTNLGVIGNPWKALSTDPSGQYPPGSGVEYLYASGIWVGAKIGADPNPYVSTALYQTEFRPSTLPIDTIYESYEGFPGATRFFNDDGDTDPEFGLEYIDEEIHDGKDNDDDGEIDEDFAAISQQMFTCVYRDDTQEALNTFAEHVPMGLEVVQESFAWGIPGSDNFVGFEFTITNEGRQDLYDLYLGFLCDGDAGPESEENYWRDDRAGLVQIDTTVGGAASGGCSERLRLDVGYTADADGDGGRAEGWFGVMFLGHTTDPKGEKAPPTVGFTSFRFVSGGSAYEKCGDPGNDLQRYDLLSSGEIGCRPGQFDATEDADYRIFFGTGPFSELLRGETLKLQVAFVVGVGRQGMIENAVAAQRIYNGAYEDQDENPDTGVDGKETCLTKLPGEELPEELDPFDYLEWCDFPDSLKAILRELPQFRPVPITEPTCEGTGIVQYVDLDCDPCTGIDGKEMAVRWRGASTPPCPQVLTEYPADEEYPCNELKLDEDGFLAKSALKGPSVRLSARDQAVVIQWNNAAELVPDPLSGDFDFAGYRIWKAEQWERPEGSTGPTPELWSLLAEYRLPKYQNPKSGHRNLELIRNETLAPCDTTDPAQGLILYPVGYYQHRDDRVLNGFTYFYSVTAFDLNETDDRDPITGELEVFTLECRTVASAEQAVVPGSDPVEKSGEVYVVPNPYYGTAAWDLEPNAIDPTGTHVDFMNMPVGDWTLKIYTVSGDLVRTLENDGSQNIGQIKWDLVSRNGQDVVSGLYLFTVESGFGTQVGKFVVLRD
jgi:hypothetical protein